MSGTFVFPPQGLGAEKVKTCNLPRHTTPVHAVFKSKIQVKDVPKIPDRTPEKICKEYPVICYSPEGPQAGVF